MTRRLPLFTALAMARNRSYTTGIEELVQAYPRALQLRDAVTGLFAFQLAAVSASDSDTDTCMTVAIDSSCCSMETVFELLRACPSVLR